MRAATQQLYRAIGIGFITLFVVVTANAVTPATVILTNLSQIYDGTAKSVSYETDPAGLSVVLTYDGSPSAPTNVGSYIVVAMVSDSDFEGGATNTFVISCAPITLSGDVFPTSNEWDIAFADGVNIVPGTEDVGVHGDDEGTTISFPFPIRFYDRTFTSGYVSANGNLQFVSTVNDLSPQAFPYANFNYVISPLWSDWRTDSAGGGIFTSISGAAPNRIFNIEWRTVHYGTSTVANFEVRLYENSTRIDFVYGQVDNNGANAVVGVQRDTGSAVNLFEANYGGVTAGLQLTFYTAVTATGGVAPYTFAVTDGSLPVGLALASDGSFLGTRTALGNDTFTITATDASGCTESQTYSLATTCTPITLEPTVVPHLLLGERLSQPLSAVGGVPPYTFTLSGKSLPKGIGLTLDGVLFGTAYVVGTNSFDVTVSDVFGCSATGTFSIGIAATGVSADSTKPVVTIGTPLNRKIFTTSAVTILGRITDPGIVRSGVAVGYYSFNGGPLTTLPTANKFTNWSVNVTLQPGWNTFVVQATDNVGNTSDAKTNIFFLGNPKDIIGYYNGLFYETNSSGAPAMREQSAGAIVNLYVTMMGSLSGKIYIDGTNYNVKGIFDVNGNCTTNVSRGTRPELTARLHLDWTGASKQITGTISCAGEGWTSAVLADLAIYNGISNPYKGQSRFTMAIAPATNAPANSPGGYGYGTINITSAGRIVLNGALADAATTKQNIPISKDGHWPLYVSLYKGAGLLEGWLDFSGGAPAGLVTWIKPANATDLAPATYPAGFTNRVTVFGSAYTPVSLALLIPTGILNITDGTGLNLPLTLHVAVNANNTLSALPPTTNAVSGSIALSSGQMSANFRPTGISLTVTARGAVLQSSNAAYGAFVGRNDGTGKTNTGAIYLH